MLINLETMQPWAGEQLGGVGYPANIETLWLSAALREIGLAFPEPFVVPPGKVTTGPATYDLAPNGAVKTIYAVEDAPPPPPTVIFKADIWRRATEAEAETLDALLSAQPARLRRMWSDSQTLMSSDEMYPVVLAAVTQAFGENRASELLAPSE